MVTELGAADGGSGLLVGAAEAFLVDRSAVFVREQQVIGPAFVLLLVPRADIYESS